LIKVVRPTKIELIKLRRRLVLADRIEKIVKDRLSILVVEFLQVAGDIVEAKERLITRFAEAYKAISIAGGYHGYVALEKELLATERDVTITGGARNVAGTRVPSLELKAPPPSMRNYNLIDTSSLVDQAAQLSEKCLEVIIELAELQRSLELLGTEIGRTKRIVNALDHLIIPGLRETIKYLKMKFEERDREEKARLKRVKVLLEQR